MRPTCAECGAPAYYYFKQVRRHYCAEHESTRNFLGKAIDNVKS